jgi:Flp pilus assembly pilin Flp
MLASQMSPELRALMIRRKNRRRGQGMTEYIIIVGLIAILMVAAVLNFKEALNNAFDKGANKIQNDITNKMG